MYKNGVVDQMPAYPIEITDGWTSTPVSHHKEYDVYQFEGQADTAIPRHCHPDHMEVIYVVSGEVNLRLGREDACLSQGAVQTIYPGKEHEIICVSQDTILLSIFQPPISVSGEGDIDHTEIFNQLQ